MKARRSDWEEAARRARVWCLGEYGLSFRRQIETRSPLFLQRVEVELALVEDPRDVKA